MGKLPRLRPHLGPKSPLRFLPKLSFLPNVKIAVKLPLVVVGMAMLFGLGVGVSAYLISLETVQTQREASLNASVQASYDQLSAYFQGVETDVKLMARRGDTVNALEFFSYGFSQDSMTGKSAESLRQAYLTDNPNDPSNRFKFDSAGRANNAYDIQHTRFHSVFRSLMLAHGYADVALFDVNGTLVYSAAKRDDFGLSAGAGGALETTGIGAAFKVAALQPEGVVKFIDFAGYGPAGNVPQSFIAAPVYKGPLVIGVLVFAIPADGISIMLQGARGLGKTGEVLLVGADNLLRSDSRFSEASDVLVTWLDVPALTADATVASEYRGIPLTATDVSFAFKGVKWRIVAVQATEEVLAPVTQMRNMMLMVGGLLLAVAAVVGLVFSRSIAKPISRLTSTMEALAAGDLAVDVQGAGRRDEIGQMAKAVEVFRENGLRMAQMTEAEAARIIRDQEARTQMMAQLQQAFGDVVNAAVAGDFSRQIDAAFPDAELNAIASSINDLVATVDRGLGETGHVLSALADTDLTRRVEGEYSGAFAQLKHDTNAVADKLTEIVGQLKDTSRSLKVATGEILAGANDLSERTTKQAATIEETSATMEQLASTVAQNADRAKEASQSAGVVTRTAEVSGTVMHEATEAMERITASSGKISNIIGMIDDIAFQTNLLALNASVEAARAGEAGAGFAVVAVEVRRLAQSAAKASSDVKVLIEQSSGEVKTGSKLVDDAAAKLQAMLTAARSSNELMDGIARESREQAASIEEMTSAVRQLDEMTQHNAALVEEINASIEQTESQATELDRIVDVFATAEASKPAAQAAPAEKGIRALQARVKTAAKSYLSHGSAAVAKDWAEF